MNIFQTRFILTDCNAAVVTRLIRCSIFWKTTSKSITKVIVHLSDCLCTRPGLPIPDTSRAMKSNPSKKQKKNSQTTQCIIDWTQVFGLAVFIWRRLSHHHQRAAGMGQEPDINRQPSVYMRWFASTGRLHENGLRLQTRFDAVRYGTLHEYLQPAMPALLPLV